MAVFSSNISAYLNKLFGEDAAKKFSEFINKEPSQYIRVNRLKTTPEKLISVLQEDYDIKAEAIPGINSALKISGRTDLTGKTIEHIIGEYYMQGLSSMIPPIILSPSPDNKVLDLCAAPGSKTTEIAELMNNKGTLIANEIAMDRAMALLYNIERMNILNAGVIHFKGEVLSKIYDNYFDKILVDAPCSGLGILQKRDEVNDWWSEERAKALGDIQLKLLIAAIKMVKTGGEIVYSTCTLTPEENEGIIDKVLKKYPVELMDVDLPFQAHEGFTSFGGSEYNAQIKKTRRILPWEADTDGFFIARIRKTGDTNSLESMELKKREFRFLKPSGKELKNLLTTLSSVFGIEEDIFHQYKYHMRGGDIYFVSGDWEDENPGIFERIGTRFGIVDKKNEITFHSQAAQILQNHISKNIYSINDREEFKKYIEGGVIKAVLPPGQYVVKYKEYILGTAVSTKEGLKSRFPRAKRTQGIYY
jgi:16S rRNA (cytosine1407-C5)-methyltransferase